MFSYDSNLLLPHDGQRPQPPIFFFLNTCYFKSCYSGNIKFIRIKLDKEDSILLLVKKILNNRINQTHFPLNLRMSK